MEPKKTDTNVNNNDDDDDDDDGLPPIPNTTKERTPNNEENMEPK